MFTVTVFHPRISEQRTETEHFQDHSADDTGRAHWIVEFLSVTVLDPRQGFLLRARGGDSKRHWTFRPIHDFADDPHKEDEDGQIRNDDPEKPFQVSAPHADKGNRHKRENDCLSNNET